MTENLGKEILGAIQLHPELLERLPDLSDVLKSTYNILIYRAQKKVFNQNLNIDIGILAEELNGKVPAAYISGLLNGFPKSLATLNVVLEKIRRLKIRNLKDKILSEANKENRLLEKGLEPDLTQLRSLFEELDDLINRNSEILKPLSSISPKEINWLWPNCIPTGSLTLFAGDPGDGKSILCEYLAARLSKGDQLPDHENFAHKGSTIFITAEDNLSDTVRVRADEARSYYSF